MTIKRINNSKDSKNNYISEFKWNKYVKVNNFISFLKRILVKNKTNRKI